MSQPFCSYQLKDQVKMSGTIAYLCKYYICTYIIWLVVVGKELLDSLNPWLSRAGPALPVLGEIPLFITCKLFMEITFSHLSEIHNMPPVALKPCEVCSDGEAHTDMVGLRPNLRVWGGTGCYLQKPFLSKLAISQHHGLVLVRCRSNTQNGLWSASAAATAPC